MNAFQRTMVERVRDISLGELLRWHGFEIKPEAGTYRATNERYNIVVTKNRWFDNKAALGGIGAIGLQMHLTGEDFAAACQTLLKASVPSQFGGFTVRRPALSSAPWQNVAPNALHCGHCSGRRALRVPGPSAIADAAIQPTFPESSGFVRPFFPSSPSHKPRLRANRKGGGIRFDLSSGVLGNQLRDSLEPPSPTDRAFLPKLDQALEAIESLM